MKTSNVVVFIILTATLLSGSVFAQDKIDSLKMELSKQEKENKKKEKEDKKAEKRDEELKESQMKKQQKY